LASSSAKASLVAEHPLGMAAATSMGHPMVFRFDKERIVRLLHEDADLRTASCHTRWLAPVRVEEDLVDQLFNSTEK